MKNKLTPITILITLLIVILGYFAYTKFIRSAYLNNSAQNLEIKNLDGETIVITKLKEQSRIYGIELEFGPSKHSNYRLIVSNNKEKLHEIQVKKGKEYIYKNDWYSDTCLLNIKTDLNPSDRIALEYRFLGLNKE